MTIVNDNSRVINKLEASLTDNASHHLRSSHVYSTSPQSFYVFSPFFGKKIHFYLQKTERDFFFITLKHVSSCIRLHVDEKVSQICEKFGKIAKYFSNFFIVLENYRLPLSLGWIAISIDSRT
jgi:hypothetical protein